MSYNLRSGKESQKKSVTENSQEENSQEDSLQEDNFQEEMPQEQGTGNMAINNQGMGNMPGNNTGTIGSIRVFTLDEDFKIWHEQFEQYVAANLVPEGRAVSLFLTLMGGEGYKLVRNLCVLQKPNEKSLIELVTLIKGHLKPKPNMIAERFKFKKRCQQQNEKVNMFLASLKQLSLYCEFGDTLEDNLRDQLILGLNNERIQRKLLSEKQLTLDKAVDLTVAWETAEKEAQGLYSSTHGADQSTVNYVAAKGKQSNERGKPSCFQPNDRGKPSWPQQNKRGRTSCFRCGQNNHSPHECKFKNYMCNLCKKVGHII